MRTFILGLMVATIAASCEGSAGPGAGHAEVRAAWIPPKQFRELIDARRFDEARALAESLLTQAEAIHGPDAIEVAQALDLLVEVQWRSGATEQNTFLQGERAVRIKDTHLDAWDPDLAPSLRNLAELLRLSGRAKYAKPHCERALRIMERARPAVDSVLADYVKALGNVHLDLGDYALAKEHYERVEAIQEKLFGPDAPQLAGTIYNIAITLRRMGDFEEARPLYDRALDIQIRADPEHSYVQLFLNGLAYFLYQTGNFAEARTHYERVLEIRMERYGPEHLQVSHVLNNLGLVDRAIGDYTQAQARFKESLHIRDSVWRADHPTLAQSLHNLASVLALIGEYSAAVPLFERALEIVVDVYDEDDPRMAAILQTYAGLRLAMGDDAAARRLYTQAKEINTKSLGPDHYDVALCLNGLASIHMRAGEADEARKDFQLAVKIREQKLGPKHPMVAESANGLAELFFRTGDLHAALPQALRTERIAREHLLETARTLPERQALRYAAARASGLDIAMSIVAEHPGPKEARQSWDAVIRSRALVLDEVASRHRTVGQTGDPEIAPLAARLDEARTRLARALVSSPDPQNPELHRARVDAAREAKEQAERALAEKSVAFREELRGQRAGFAEVAHELNRSEALLAYARYERRSAIAPSQADSKARPPLREVKIEPCYLAFVLLGGSTDPLAVPLGSAERVERQVAEWRKEAGREVTVSSRSLREAACRSAGIKLRRQVWDPLSKALKGIERVYVVPDGALHLINLAALPDGDDGYLLETAPLIHHLSAERDLVTRSDEPMLGVGLLAIGDPDFNSRGTERGSVNVKQPGAEARADRNSAQPVYRGRRTTCGDFASVQFVSLPSSLSEVDGIASLWKESDAREPTRRQHDSEDVVKLVGASAKEASFKAMVSGRRVLHLATHGFFLGSGCSPVGSTRGIGGLSPSRPQTALPEVAENPLLLSGLAFAGANRRQSVGSDEEDGILTAEEIAALDLRGTEWAVLSACDTGVGEIQNGEGVLGLRRAFQIAGAKTIIMSLWSVEDRSTDEWMRALYKARLLDGLSTPEALRQASLSNLKERRSAAQSTHPFFWGAWVAAGGVQ